MNMTDPVASNEADLAEAFPAVDPGAAPLGGRVLVQLRAVEKERKHSGIILVEETTDQAKWQNMVAKVLVNGPLAFKKRDSMESWPEGSWCEPGDYIRVPKWGGDRWYVSYGEKGKALFMILNDHEIIAKLTGDPLTMDTPL